MERSNGGAGTAWIRATHVLVVLCCCYGGALISAQQQPQVPALFVFGDSLIDDGNNNYIPSLARANYPPYGIDFSQGPTGRFCNGRTAIDVLGQLLGLSFIPAYSNPSTRGPAILQGVNYASAAAGILNETGRNYVARISFNQQLSNFQTTLGDLTSQLGSAAVVAQYLSKSIFAVGFGSNDFINNYLMPNLYSSSRQYTPQTYTDLLISQYSKQLMTLYNLGGRKFVLSAVGPLGCIPSQLAMANTNGSCIDSINQQVVLFNAKLRSLVINLNANFPGAHFVYGDVYDAFADIINNPASYGFTVTNRGCCGIGRNRGQITCLPQQLPCANRNQHVFWDAFHPTEAVNIILSRKAYSGPPSDSYPINVMQLAQL
eukprot:Gb_30432 [translate_table: standard]